MLRAGEKLRLLPWCGLFPPLRACCHNVFNGQYRIFTAFFRQQAEFFARSEQWLEKKYGKDRVVAAVVHRDEATPHLSAFVV
ncbi:plasmid recombination protein, partial [Escherichia coli]|uniref:plasmid recombination protein n=1 Tax=Escherichia coli TaxID=562 RepID=UPI00204125AC